MEIAAGQVPARNRVAAERIRVAELEAVSFLISSCTSIEGLDSPGILRKFIKCAGEWASFFNAAGERYFR